MPGGKFITSVVLAVVVVAVVLVFVPDEHKGVTALVLYGLLSVAIAVGATKAGIKVRRDLEGKDRTTG
jgi:hypothetical protein